MSSKASLPGFCAEPMPQLTLLSQHLPDATCAPSLVSSSWHGCPMESSVFKFTHAWVSSLEIPISWIWDIAWASGFSKSSQMTITHSSQIGALLSEDERRGGTVRVEQ